MTPDRKRIRKHRVTLNLDDYEQGLITALVNYIGIDQATLLRQLVMRAAQSHFIDADQLKPDMALPELDRD